MPSGKKMYSTQLKLEIVQRYLQGNIGVKQLAEEYHVHKGDIQKWRDAYLEHGIDGLNVKSKTYTGDFKIFVVEYMHHTGSFFRKTSAHFNIPCRDLTPSRKSPTSMLQRHKWEICLFQWEYKLPLKNYDSS